MLNNESIINFNQNVEMFADPNVIIAIETGIIVIITGVYALFTYKIILEQQRDRKLRWIEKQIEECYLPLYSDLKFHIDKEFEDFEKRMNSPAHIYDKYDKYNYMHSSEIIKALDNSKNVSESYKLIDGSKVEINPKIKDTITIIEETIEDLKTQHQSLIK